MAHEFRLLNNVQVASPCPAAWEGMTPVGEGDRVRFCGECRLNVYDLSAMTAPEAEALLAAHSGRLCITFFRRADGTVLTKDCPVGMQVVRVAARRQAVRRSMSAAALLTSLAVIHLPALAAPGKKGRKPRPKKTVRVLPRREMSEPLMGAVISSSNYRAFLSTGKAGTKPAPEKAKPAAKPAPTGDAATGQVRNSADWSRALGVRF